MRKCAAVPRASSPRIRIGNHLHTADFPIFLCFFVLTKRTVNRIIKPDFLVVFLLFFPF